MKEHALPMLDEIKTYRSPRHKLVRFFERSRDGWKAKCQSAKTALKRMRNERAVLRKSRERWKDLAHLRGQELAELRRALEVQKSGGC